MWQKKRLGDMLVESGLVTPEEVQAALADQKTSGRRLGRILIGMGLVSETQVKHHLAIQMKISFVDLSHYLVDPVVARLLPEAFCREHTLVALKRVDRHLFVAMDDPLNLIALDDIQTSTGLLVRPRFANASGIVAKIDEVYAQR
jgi:type IV pilus assembly protein PilB